MNTGLSGIVILAGFLFGIISKHMPNKKQFIFVCIVFAGMIFVTIIEFNYIIPDSATNEMAGPLDTENQIDLERIEKFELIKENIELRERLEELEENSRKTIEDAIVWCVNNMIAYIAALLSPYFSKRIETEIKKYKKAKKRREKVKRKQIDNISKNQSVIK